MTCIGLMNTAQNCAMPLFVVDSIGGLRGLSGLDVVRHMNGSGLSVPVIVMGGRDERDFAEKVSAVGAVGYLPKPVDDQDLLEAPAKAMNKGIVT
jgi:FixJ family two-component response regulator